MVLVSDRVEIRGTVLAILRDVATGRTLRRETTNIVTNDGDLFYAQRAVQAIPTNFTNLSGAFDGVMELYNGASAAPAKGNDRSDLVGLVSGSTKTMDALYPLIGDTDPDNTGAGADIVTYRVTYDTGEANGSGIADVIVTNPSPGAAEPVLQHAEFGAPFAKTSSQVLKVFVNHQLNGV